VKLRGWLDRKTYAAGSKSEHEAVVLVTRDGEYRVLQRGGNPFADEGLSALVGKQVEVEGDLSGPALVADRIDLL
jgi:hypothetical protein